MGVKAIRVPRFRIQTLLLLIVIAALLFGWWTDHNRLVMQMEEMQRPRDYWGTNQLLGPPDTASSGDLPTAWASQTPDGSREWILVEFPIACYGKSVWIYETYNPGAVNKISVIDQSGRESVVWQGTDPTARGSKMGISKIPINTDFKFKLVKIDIDSPSVAGWNEIDAVALIDETGIRQWASNAYSSSSFGRNNRLPSRLENWIP